MRRFLPFVFCGLLITIVGWSRADEPDADPIKAKLTAAKTTFDAETVKFRESVSSTFETREAAARKDGNKKLLDEIKMERKQFDDKGLLPRSVPAAVRQKMLTAITKFEAAYELAIKQYTIAKKDDQATVTEKERDAFKRQIEHFESKLDAFQLDTVWKGSFTSIVLVRTKQTEKKTDLELQVAEREGKSFKIALSYGGGIQAEGVGTIEKGKIEWKRNVKNLAKKTESTIDFTGTVKDDKLYFEFVDNSNGQTGKGVLVLEKKK